MLKDYQCSLQFAKIVQSPDLFLYIQACKCAGISGNFARASPNALEAMIITIIVIVVFGVHEIMKGP